MASRSAAVVCRGSARLAPPPASSPSAAVGSRRRRPWRRSSCRPQDRTPPLHADLVVVGERRPGRKFDHVAGVARRGRGSRQDHVALGVHRRHVEGAPSVPPARTRRRAPPFPSKRSLPGPRRTCAPNSTRPCVDIDDVVTVPGEHLRAETRSRRSGRRPRARSSIELPLVTTTSRALGARRCGASAAHPTTVAASPRHVSPAAAALVGAAVSRAAALPAVDLCAARIVVRMGCPRGRCACHRDGDRTHPASREVAVN